jgi:hypothetical protein
LVRIEISTVPKFIPFLKFVPLFENLKIWPKFEFLKKWKEVEEKGNGNRRKEEKMKPTTVPDLVGALLGAQRVCGTMLGADPIGV